MRSKYLYILAVLMLLTGCSLKEDQLSEVTQKNFYKTVGQCESALRALYTPLHYIYTDEFMHAVEGVADLWCTTSADENAFLDITPAKPEFGTTMWRYCYIGIMRSNECVDCIAKAPVDEDSKLPMIAEARAMRAFYYYLLTCFFGDVPFYTYPVDDIETMETIRTLPRTSATEIRTALYDDLYDNALPFYTEENGLRVRANEIRDNHAGFALTAMLMAKMAMWNACDIERVADVQEWWKKAKYALEELEKVYVSLDSYPLEEIQWRYKNTDEGIFEVQHEWNANGVKFYGEVANVMTPSCSDGLYDGVYMPELSKNGASWAAMKTTKQYALYRMVEQADKSLKPAVPAIRKPLFEAFPLRPTDELYEYKSGNTTKFRRCNAIDMEALRTGLKDGKPYDKRVIYKFGFGNLTTGETFKNVKTDGTMHPGPQFWCPGMTNTYDSNNYRVFRYADAVLMLAECNLELGNVDKAEGYLNQVRRRAGLDDFSGTFDLQEIKNERGRELGGEFQRKFDLVRWGDWYELTSKVAADNGNAKKLSARIKPYHRFYPIPDAECALSEYMLTNPEYEANDENN